MVEGKDLTLLVLLFLTGRPSGGVGVLDRVPSVINDLRGEGKE